MCCIQGSLQEEAERGPAEPGQDKAPGRPSRDANVGDNTFPVPFELFACTVDIQEVVCLFVIPMRLILRSLRGHISSESQVSFGTRAAGAM